MGFSARLFEVVLYPESFSVDSLPEILCSHSICNYAWILHDKDNKKPHIHLMIRTNDSCQSDYVAKWFGVLSNAVCKVKGRFADALLYLTHANAPDKHQYDTSLVTSNFDWVSEVAKTKSHIKLDDIVTKIASGEIREYNYHDYISAVDFVKFRRQIDSAFAYRTNLIKGVSRNMDCIFISGVSGCGKTTYAREIASNKNMSVFVSSGSNDILDGYAGQDCIILDDLRPSCLGLSDLLKMLDNNTSSTVKSRYRNKVLECKMIIITTTLDIDMFFRNVFMDEIESCIQLQRRCRTLVQMDYNIVSLRVWQCESLCYSKPFSYKNTIIDKFSLHDMSDVECVDYLDSVLGNISDKFLEIEG